MNFLNNLRWKLRKNQSNEPVYVQNCERWISIHDPLKPRGGIDVILVDGKKIGPWAARQFRDVIGGSPNGKAARAFLPDWLVTIPKGSKLVTRPESNLNDLIFSGLDYFIHRGWIKFWCDECDEFVFRVNDETRHKTFNGETSEWESVIFCVEDHEVFKRQRKIKYLGILSSNINFTFSFFCIVDT